MPMIDRRHLTEDEIAQAKFPDEHQLEVCWRADATDAAFTKGARFYSVELGGERVSVDQDSHAHECRRGA